jgi:hypothetical protein
MRAAWAFLLFGAWWTGEAGASSFLVLPPLEGKTSPSIITLEPQSFADVTMLPAPGQTPPDTTVGQVDQPPRKPDPADSDIVTLTPSVIAMGEPDVAQEKVAAIGEEKPKTEEPRAKADALPMVIRGGIVGDAFSPGATGEPVPLTVEPKESGQASAAPPPSKKPSRPPEQTTETQPATPPPPEPEIKLE